MRVAVTVGWTATMRLSRCSLASALTKPRIPHLLAPYGPRVAVPWSDAVLAMTMTASRTCGSRSQVSFIVPTRFTRTCRSISSKP